MEIGNIIPHIEALIFASEKPLTSMEITELVNNAFGFMEEKLTLEQIQTSIDGIIEKYRSEFYPFEVRESGGGWQFLTKKDFHKTVAQLNGEKFLKRLSSAALETLSIIAYKQPITKGEIESIRGVSSDYSIQKLLEKELIVITGRNEDMPGKPLVYCTSKGFMDYFGINSAADLPKLKEVFAENLVAPTIVGASESAEGMTDEERVLIVGEDGQLIEHAENPSEENTNTPTGEADETGDVNDLGAAEAAVEAVDTEAVEGEGAGETGESDETGDLDGEEDEGEDDEDAAEGGDDDGDDAADEDGDDEDDENDVDDEDEDEDGGDPDDQTEDEADEDGQNDKDQSGHDSSGPEKEHPEK